FVPARHCSFAWLRVPVCGDIGRRSHHRAFRREAVVRLARRLAPFAWAIRRRARAGPFPSPQDVVVLIARTGGHMHLTPRERDKLMIALAATVARERLAQGVKLNYPESIALISDFVLEGARDEKSVAELMSAGGKILTRDQVMEGIPEMIAEVEVEA